MSTRARCRPSFVIVFYKDNPPVCDRRRHRYYLKIRQRRVASMVPPFFYFCRSEFKNGLKFLNEFSKPIKNNRESIEPTIRSQRPKFFVTRYFIIIFILFSAKSNKMLRCFVSLPCQGVNLFSVISYSTKFRN